MCLSSPTMAGSVALRCVNRSILTLTRAAPVSVRCYVPTDKSVHVPPPPKKPLTSYLSFSCKVYPQVMKQHPDSKCPDVARKIGAMWKSMPEQEKQSYAPNFKSEMKAYVERRRAYMDELTPQQQQALKTTAQEKKKKRQKMQKRKISKELDKPKRPPNGYLLYSNKQRANREGEFKSQTDLLRKIAEEWRALADEDKQLYNDAAADLQRRYHDALLVWEEKMIEEGRPELVRGYRRPKAAGKRRGHKKKRKMGAKAKKAKLEE